MRTKSKYPYIREDINTATYRNHIIKRETSSKHRVLFRGHPTKPLSISECIAVIDCYEDTPYNFSIDTLDFNIMT